MRFCLLFQGLGGGGLSKEENPRLFRGFPCFLGGHFGYLLFFLLGAGEGGVRGAGRVGGAILFFNGKSQEGGGFQGGWGAGGSARGREGVCGEFGIGAGG